MKILIAPDKFKGSLTALDVCNAVEKGILNILPKAELIKLPLADGGEGSLDVFKSTIKFEQIYCTVNNPLFKHIRAWYGLKNDTAYIEMAIASGLQLLTDDKQNPNLTSSYGTGELIVDAINRGAKKIFLFIGGSATNDGGIGIASALGYKFLDGNNIVLKPIGNNLSKVKTIIAPIDNSFNKFEIVVLTDVKNPFFGDNGAAYVYAAQKGADEKSIEELDCGLRNIADLIRAKFNMDIASIPGSGAAGGIGGGMIAFCNAKLRSGIDEIFNLLNIDKYIEEYDFIISGEGKLDIQSLQGKVVKGIMDKCKKFKKPLGIICGISDLPKEKLEEWQDVHVISLSDDIISQMEAIKRAEQLVVKRSEEMIHSLYF